MTKVLIPKIEWVSVNCVTSKANLPILAIKYNRAGRPSEHMDKQQYGATITIVRNGSTAKKLLVTLKEKHLDVQGTIVSDAAEYALEGEVTATLDGLVDAINAIPGFTAWALHAPHSLSTNADTFVDAAEAPISEGDKASEVLQRAATATTAYLRINESDVRNTGRIRLTRVEGCMDCAAAATFKLWRDEKGKPAEVIFEAAVPAAGWNTLFASDRKKGPVYQIPLVAEISATEITGLDYRIHTTQAW